MKYLSRALIMGMVILMAVGTVSAADYLTNGGFETPVVNGGYSWNIFASGTDGLGWTVEWSGGSATYGGVARPAVANLELQKAGTVSGRSPYAGSQYAELDSDWKGPTSSQSGEPANVKITQTIATIPGNGYVISWQDGCRQDESGQCRLGLIWDGVESGNIYNPPKTGWAKRTVYPGTAAGTTSVVGFVDKGAANSLGVLLDDVKIAMAGISVSGSCPETDMKSGKVVITYTVKNTGDLTLTDIIVDDGLNPAPVRTGNGDGDEQLSAGESWTYQRSIDTLGLVQYEVTAKGKYADQSGGLWVSGTNSGTCDPPEEPIQPVPEFPVGVYPACILGLVGIGYVLAGTRIRR